MLIEGVHFDLTFTPAYCLGFKLISVNVSDIYAMGGLPFAAFLSLAFSPEIDQVFFDDFYSGVEDAISLYNLDLLGGDLCSSPLNIAISATVLGESERTIYRCGAKEGDLICVTGTLGDSAMGLKLLQALDNSSKTKVAQSKDLKTLVDSRLSLDTRKGNRTLSFKGSDFLPLIRRHLMPTARDSQQIAPYATSMIDISDGLFIDLYRLCEESQVGAMVYEQWLPVSKELLEASLQLGIDPLSAVTSGGEDYELLFTIPPGVSIPHVEGLKITSIGEITKDSRLFISNDGRSCEITPKGYEHFRS